MTTHSEKCSTRLRDTKAGPKACCRPPLVTTSRLKCRTWRWSHRHSTHTTNLLSSKVCTLCNLIPVPSFFIFYFLIFSYFLLFLIIDIVSVAPTVTVQAEDDKSGSFACTVTFASGQETKTASLTSTGNGRTLTGQLTIPKLSPAAVFTVSNITCRDAYGRTADANPLKFPVSFQQVL